MEQLNLTTYYDYNQEGELAYQLGIQEEKNPFLICFFESEEDDYYKLYIEELDEFEKEVWYLPFLNNLLLVETFEIYHPDKVIFKIYEVIDKIAYSNIWKMASVDLGINYCTVSGYSDIKELIEFIKETPWNDKELPLSTLWMYSLKYGGGSDEYYALFKTRDNETNKKFLKIKDLINKKIN